MHLITRQLVCMSQCNLNIQAVCSVSADGFVVQTGDPEGPAEGFVNPGTGLVRTVPLEIMVDGEKAPIYGSTLEVCCSAACVLTSTLKER
jgi:hypothetical protein